MHLYVIITYKWCTNYLYKNIFYFHFYKFYIRILIIKRKLINLKYDASLHVTLATIEKRKTIKAKKKISDTCYQK